MTSVDKFSPVSTWQLYSFHLKVTSFDIYLVRVRLQVSASLLFYVESIVVVSGFGGAGGVERLMGGTCSTAKRITGSAMRANKENTSKYILVLVVNK